MSLEETEYFDSYIDLDIGDIIYCQANPSRLYEVKEISEDTVSMVSIENHQIRISWSKKSMFSGLWAYIRSEHNHTDSWETGYDLLKKLW